MMDDMARQILRQSERKRLCYSGAIFGCYSVLDLIELQPLHAQNRKSLKVPTHFRSHWLSAAPGGCVPLRMAGVFSVSGAAAAASASESQSAEPWIDLEGTQCTGISLSPEGSRIAVAGRDGELLRGG
jgi:hypothetical protein